MEVARHVQNTQNRNLVILLQYIKKLWQLLCVLLWCKTFRYFMGVQSCSLLLVLAKLFIYKFDSFTGYKRIMIEPMNWDEQRWTHELLGVLLKLLFSINCQTTRACRAICSLHFHHLWVCHTVNYMISPHMWVRHTVRMWVCHI